MSRHLNWQESLFDVAAYARKVSITLAERNLSYREAARQIGISPATLYHAAKGRRSCDVETFFRINKWIEESQP